MRIEKQSEALSLYCIYIYYIKKSGRNVTKCGKGSRVENPPAMS